MIFSTLPSSHAAMGMQRDAASQRKLGSVDTEPVLAPIIMATDGWLRRACEAMDRQWICVALHGAMEAEIEEHDILLGLRSSYWVAPTRAL